MKERMGLMEVRIVQSSMGLCAQLKKRADCQQQKHVRCAILNVSGLKGDILSIPILIYFYRLTTSLIDERCSSIGDQIDRVTERQIDQEGNRNAGGDFLD